MTTPLPLWHGIVLEQMLVGAAASLVNIIIHAVLLGAVVWTVRGLAQKDSFVPGFVQYTIIIVATGTLLMTGHFVEVMVWAITYGLVGVAPASVQLIYLAFDNYTTLGYAGLVAPEQWRLLRPMTALNGIMLIGWSTALGKGAVSNAAQATGRMFSTHQSRYGDRAIICHRRGQI